MSAEADRARAKRWYNANIDRVQRNQAEWRRRNRRYIRAYWQNYRSTHKVEKACEVAGCHSPVGWHKRKFCDTHSVEYNREHRRKGYYDSLGRRRANRQRLLRRLLGGDSQRQRYVRGGVAA